MIKTYGLTHIALIVENVQRASDFYNNVFGTREMYKTEEMIQVQTPGSHDIIVFEQGVKPEEKNCGIKHFGFRLADTGDADMLVRTIEQAGGRVKERGEFVPGEPYVFMYDPDGYEVEIWYEKLPEGEPSFN